MLPNRNDHVHHIPNMMRAQSFKIIRMDESDESTNDIDISRNMQEIIPGVFLGPYSAAKRSRLDKLKNSGITNIIYITQDMEIEAPLIVDFNYLTLNITDSVGENIIPHFGQAIEFINKCIESKGKVLVVGPNGVSRSATIVIAYVMQKHKLSCKEAYTLVKKQRSCIQPNHGFMHELRKFEAIYKGEQPVESSIIASTSNKVNSCSLI